MMSTRALGEQNRSCLSFFLTISDQSPFQPSTNKEDMYQAIACF